MTGLAGAHGGKTSMKKRMDAFTKKPFRGMFAYGSGMSGIEGMAVLALPAIKNPGG
ncbi:hypothetical protein JW933_08525 [candidate division FCPU426 bacterium]|nr:hypothetical protein [candidate division FCPU426 bacterium]